jgi:hypothetical protein
VAIQVETRGQTHAATVIELLREAGYRVVDA